MPFRRGVRRGIQNMGHMEGCISRSAGQAKGSNVLSSSGVAGAFWGLRMGWDDGMGWG